jgi:outer membrane protein, multidrug efflux system
VQRSQAVVKALGANAAKAACVLGVTTWLAGCASFRVPEYQRPQTAVNANWSRPAGLSATGAIMPQWWTQFGDATLDSLVARAIEANIDLRVLVARVGSAKVQIAEAHAGALPSVDIIGSDQLQKTLGFPSINEYSVGAQASWELDLWGKVKKGVQAQAAEFHASEADWRAGYLQVVANVATSYFMIRQLDQQIGQQQRALANNEHILAIDEGLSSNGLMSDSDVARQRGEIHRLTSDLLELSRSRDTTENALATLLGVPAGDFKLPADGLQERVRVPDVPMVLPLDLLARRPDVVAAEFRVLEAHDLMGQARLAQLPTVNLAAQASLGGTSTLTEVFKAFTFGFTPSIDIPLLNPQVRAHAKTTEAQLKVAEDSYRQTVLAAFEEVENALVDLDAHRRQEVQLQMECEQLQQVADQTAAQLREGLVSQLDVFENQRSMLTAQLARLNSHGQVLADTIVLYKALGGGWDRVEVTNAAR